MDVAQSFYSAVKEAEKRTQKKLRFHVSSVGIVHCIVFCRFLNEFIGPVIFSYDVLVIISLFLKET